MLTGGAKRVLALIVCAVCLAYAFLLLKGAYDFWAPYANLDPTSGRWFPTGFEEARDQGYAVVRPVPIPFGKEWLETTFNWYMDGDTRVVEEYDYLPRVIPYLILPLGAALLFYRVLQATIGVIRGTRQRLIVSHEAEDAVETAADKLARAETANRG
jgi:C4-dicarboxylate transporter DctQ subunit